MTDSKNGAAAVAQRIADAAAFCVPPSGPSGNGLTQVLERATAVRR